MDLSLPELSPDYLPLLMQHLHQVRLRVMSFELGQVTLTRARTGEQWQKRALGLTAVDLDQPDVLGYFRVTYQQVIDTLLPALQRAGGAPLDVTLRSFGFRNRLTFTIEVG